MNIFKNYTSLYTRIAHTHIYLFVHMLAMVEFFRGNPYQYTFSLKINLNFFKDRFFLNPRATHLKV